ncbi:MAG TPA: hypothetical protein VLG72_02700 [Nitrospirota bacterium]|nr:hypothetical protein [Nitrospirota bacterium]
MKRAAVVIVIVLLLVAAVAFAGSVKTYQVTGPVLEIKDTMVVVQKGKDKWEIAKDANTKIKGDLKVGAKVTIQYEMKATDIEVKAK